jgi:hypothetical protein
MAKRNPGMTLLEVDDLCLAAINSHFRCDRDANHYGDCAHEHNDPNLCNFMASFGEELAKIHRSVSTLTQTPQQPYTGWHGGMM